MREHQGEFQGKEERYALHDTSFRYRVRDYPPLQTDRNHYPIPSIGP